MFILRGLLVALQAPFSDSKLGRERSLWFVFTLLAVIVPFTSSMSSNLLRSLRTLFGLDLGRRRFYTFMASPKMPWQSLWQILWHLIPDPAVEIDYWWLLMIPSIIKPDAKFSVVDFSMITPPSLINPAIPGHKIL